MTTLALPERPDGRSTRRASMGSPGSRAWRLRTCTASSTARGPTAACDGAAVDVAFRSFPQRGHPECHDFAAQYPGLHVPLSTLRLRPCGRRRMTRGHGGSLLLRRRAFSSPSPCRFIPALGNFKIKSTMTGKGSQYPSDVLKRCFKTDPFLQFWTCDLRDCGMAQEFVDSWCLERKAHHSFPPRDWSCPSKALQVPSNLEGRLRVSFLANRTTSSTPDHRVAKSCSASSMTA